MIPSRPIERLVLLVIAGCIAMLVGVGYGLWRLL